MKLLFILDKNRGIKISVTEKIESGSIGKEGGVRLWRFFSLNAQFLRLQLMRIGGYRELFLMSNYKCIRKVEKCTIPADSGISELSLG